MWNRRRTWDPVVGEVWSFGPNGAICRNDDGTFRAKVRDHEVVDGFPTREEAKAWVEATLQLTEEK